MKCARLLLLLAGAGLAGQASAEVVALFGGVSGNAEIEATLTGGGHSIQNNPSLLNPITADTLYFGRGSVPFGGQELVNVQTFLNNGGRVMTEFSDAAAWFDGRLASFSGTLVDGFYVPSGDVCGYNTVTVTDPAEDLAKGLPGSWLTGDPIGVYQVYQNLDPMIHTPIMQLGTQYGDIAVAGCAGVGAGTGVIMFTDFGDFYFCGNGITGEERQLLLNAVVANCRVPAPGAAALLGMGGLVALRRRRA